MWSIHPEGKFYYTSVDAAQIWKLWVQQVYSLDS